MSIPKFAVGEVVIVACSQFPIHDGEHTIRGILEPGSIYFDRLAHRDLRTVPVGATSPFGYIMEAVLDDTDGFEVIYDERALRKKHQPGELSFEELVNEQKQPASV